MCGSDNQLINSGCIIADGGEFDGDPLGPIRAAAVVVTGDNALIQNCRSGIHMSGNTGATALGLNIPRTRGPPTGGPFRRVGAVVNNHGYERNSDIFTGGFNAKYDGDDGWSAMFDAGYSKTDRKELSLESNAGTPNVPGACADPLAGAGPGGVREVLSVADGASDERPAGSR